MGGAYSKSFSSLSDSSAMSGSQNRSYLSKSLEIKRTLTEKINREISLLEKSSPVDSAVDMLLVVEILEVVHRLEEFQLEERCRRQVNAHLWMLFQSSRCLVC